MAKKDYYETLGVPRDADEADVKKAFRRLAHKYHPDQAQGDKKKAEVKFKEISEAYEVLGDKQKRSTYDQFGSAGPQFGGDGGGGDGGGAGFEGFDFDGGGGGSFGDIFETFFGGQGRDRTHRGGAVRGSDLEVQIQIGFEEAIFGTTAEFALTRAIICDRCSGNSAEPGSKVIACKTCKGTGEVTTTRQTIFGSLRHTAICPECSGEGKTFEKKCTTCHGTGRMRKSEKVKVKIPAGVDTGSVIRLSGQGEAGAKGGPAGDLFVHLQVRSSTEFRRQNTEIHSVHLIHIAQAALGDEVEIKTVHGPVRLKIPAGTQSEQIFRLKGHGAPKLNSSERGDHLVKIVVEIPKKLSRREKELFAKLAEESGLKPKNKSGWLW